MNLIRRFILLLALTLCATPRSVNAGSPIRTPSAGTPERKAIMDALRSPVQADLRQAVIFKVKDLRVTDEWAFLNGEPLQPNGSRVDYRNTRYQERIREGIFDNGISALMRKRQGQWHVIAYSIGHTDIIYGNWDREYGVPRALLGLGF